MRASSRRLLLSEPASRRPVLRLKARTGSRDSEPDGFQIGRFGAGDGEIGRLRGVMALDNCPPRAGDGRGERFEELSGRLFGGIGGGEQDSAGLEQPQRRARKFAVILFRPKRALFLRSRKLLADRVRNDG